MAGRKELVNAVATELQMTKADTEQILKVAFEKAAELLKEDKKLSISNFGTWEVKDREARKGRNPKTGDEIDVPAHKAVTFKSFDALKDAVQ